MSAAVQRMRLHCPLLLTHSRPEQTHDSSTFEMDAANTTWGEGKSEDALKAAIQRRNDFFYSCGGRGPTYLIIKVYQRQEREFLEAERHEKIEESKRQAKAARWNMWIGMLTLLGQMCLDPFCVAVGVNCFKAVYPWVKGYHRVRCETYCEIAKSASLKNARTRSTDAHT